MYQSHKNRLQDNTKKNKPRAGWDEEDTDQKIKPTGSVWQRNSNIASASSSVRPSYEPASSSSPSYKPPETEFNTKNVIPVEQKLIDDLIQPTGISLRPNETQLKEFAKRAKNLDREIIFRTLFEKISKYEQMSDGINIKILIKCLYVIEILLQSGIKDIFDGFVEHQEIFESIRDYHSTNKKVDEVIRQILNILDPSRGASNKQTPKVNLLGDENENITKNDKQVNLLDGLTTSSPNTSNGNSNINIFNIFTTSNNTTSINNVPKQNTNILDDNIFNVESKSSNLGFINVTNTSNNNNNTSSGVSTTKQFNFIKKANSNSVSIPSNSNTESRSQTSQLFALDIGESKVVNPPQQQQSKKHFNFIKSKDTNKVSTGTNLGSCGGVSNGLDNLFNSNNVIPANQNNYNTSTNTNNDIFNMLNEVPTVDLTKINQSDIDDVFNNKPNVDVNQITSSYKQNFDINSNNQQKVDLDSFMGNHFNYQKVNEHIDVNKNAGQKDHFSFVNDMLKTKKV